MYGVMEAVTECLPSWLVWTKAYCPIFSPPTSTNVGIFMRTQTRREFMKSPAATNSISEPKICPRKANAWRLWNGE
jgi:hypothetical protein